MLERLSFSDRQSWVTGRQRGIGASEAGAVVGFSKWQSPLELWKLKTGQSVQKDLSGNPAVEQGNRMEPALRTMFGALHPQYEIEYHQFDMLYQSERPWLYATLDGELIDKDSGKRGILEIKTATPTGKAGWDEWNEQIPRGYYAQTLHQMLATGYDFVILFAALFSHNEDVILREYTISREDSQADIDWLLEQEIEFWGRVERREMPPMPIRL